MLFSFPNTATELMVVTVPVLTVLIGAGFLVLPRMMLRTMGLQTLPGHREAHVAGRAHLAGFMIGIGVACIAFQQPLLQQPGLTFMLGVAWLFTGIGKLAQILLDGARRKRVLVRAMLALVLGGIALWAAEPVTLSFGLPRNNGGLVTAIVAFVTTGIGILYFVLPHSALSFLDLEARINHPAAVGEMRGLPAGFYMGAGVTGLLVPSVFTALVLGMCWMASAAGRIVSILFDRGFTRFNLLMLAFETCLGLLPVAYVFNYLR